MIALMAMELPPRVRRGVESRCDAWRSALPTERLTWGDWAWDYLPLGRAWRIELFALGHSLFPIDSHWFDEAGHPLDGMDAKAMRARWRSLLADLSISIDGHHEPRDDREGPQIEGQSRRALAVLPAEHGSTSMFDIAELTANVAKTHIPHNTQMWIFAGMFMGFAVKVPMFPFHTWLPDAHTEAPTIGSVILAAVLLKLGTFGFIKIALPILPDAARSWATV